jgi:hypothetical protein
LGYETSSQLINGLFHTKATQDTYGVRIVTDRNDNQMYLKSPLSKYRANKKAGQTNLLQVSVVEDMTTMKHTGFTRCKATGDDQGHYTYPSLSAALRVSQREDIETGKIQEGSIHGAVFFDFDPQGDGGLPLLTLSLNPAGRRAQKNTTSPISSSKTSHPKYTPIRNPRQMIGGLQVGQGPYEAKVIRLAKDHALVDFGVGRQFSSAKHDDEAVGIGTPEFVKVFGKLRFTDAIDPDFTWDTTGSSQKATTDKTEGAFASMDEWLGSLENDTDRIEEGDGEEDITHLFNLNEDGSLRYENPDTGESEIVLSSEDDDSVEAEDVEEEDSEDVDDFEEDVAFEIDEEQDQPTSFVIPARRKGRSIRLRMGDLVPVHILSVSKQSNQFTVTTDPSVVRGKTAKDIKKEGDVSKKLERLRQMLGGLEKAEELRGREYEGTVKATSNTGDWLYVQPNVDGDGMRLPVGVATLAEELAEENELSPFAQGDMVRIQIDGIDVSRGQLAMRIIEKLSP